MSRGRSTTLASARPLKQVLYVSNIQEALGGLVISRDINVIV